MENSMDKSIMIQFIRDCVSYAECKVCPDELLCADCPGTKVRAWLDIQCEEQEDSSLDKTLEDLDVTVRSYNCLKRAGINTVGDLVKMSEEDLCHIRNMGRKCVEEIVEKLDGLGLELRREQ